MSEKHGITFRIRIVPNTKSTELVGKMADGIYKLRVQAVPEKGKANKEIISFFAEYFGVSKKNIQIVAGETGRMKKIQITGVMEGDLIFSKK